MNRILISPADLQPDGEVELVGRPARHAREVLRARSGQWLRVGLLNGPRGKGQVLALTETSIRLACVFDPEPPPPSRVDVLLALPRPKALRRLWPVLGSLGVHRLWLCVASRVDRNYLATHWLRPEYYHPLLIEGLELSGDTRIPEVSGIHRFRTFVENRLEELAPGAERWVGHPDGGAPCPLWTKRGTASSRLVVAVGPEGGWTEEELAFLKDRHFSPVSLGWRRLRSETACAALVVLAHQYLEAHAVQSESTTGRSA